MKQKINFLIKLKKNRGILKKEIQPRAFIVGKNFIDG